MSVSPELSSHLVVEHNYKIQIIDELNFWIKAEQDLKRKDTQTIHDYKIAAYKKVLDQIQSIKTIKSWKDLKDIKGIGKSIRSKLEPIFEQNVNNKRTYDNDIEKVYGVGPVKVLQLMKDYNIETVQDLYRAKNPDLLNRVQKIGLKYFNDLLRPIPRKEMNAYNKLLSTFLHKENTFDLDLFYSLVGSYRRKANQSSDIDLLLSVRRKTTHKERADILNTVVYMLEQHNYIRECLSLGDKKFMGIVKLPKYKYFRRIDILITSQEEYPFALLYFTGSKEFNIEFRKNAKNQKVVLNEHGVFDNKGTRLGLDIHTEADLFDYFNVPYIDPKNRN